MSTVKIGLQVSLVIEKRENHFAARLDPFTFTVYANNKEAAEQRVKKALVFFLNTYCPTPSAPNINKLRKYLDAHKVKHIVIRTPNRNVTMLPTCDKSQSRTTTVKLYPHMQDLEVAIGAH